jgi:hypothetical protein
LILNLNIICWSFCILIFDGTPSRNSKSEFLSYTRNINEHNYNPSTAMYNGPSYYYIFIVCLKLPEYSKHLAFGWGHFYPAAYTNTLEVLTVIILFKNFVLLCIKYLIYP